MISEDGLTWRVNEERGVLLVNPGPPISPETVAAHHIFDEGRPLPFLKRYCTLRTTPNPETLPHWQLIVRPSKGVFVPRNWRPGKIGSALGNALFEYDRNYQGSPIRCFDTNRCRMVPIITWVCQPIWQCPMPLSRPPLALPSELRVA